MTCLQQGVDLFDRVRQQKHVAAAIAQIGETDWQTIEDYPRDRTGTDRRDHPRRPARVVRRTRLVGAQAELWPDWRHFALLTNRVDALSLSRLSTDSTP